MAVVSSLVESCPLPALYEQWGRRFDCDLNLLWHIALYYAHFVMESITIAVFWMRSSLGQKVDSTGGGRLIISSFV